VGAGRSVRPPVRDRYRTLRVGEELPDRRRRRLRGGPGRLGFKAWLIGGPPY